MMKNVRWRLTLTALVNGLSVLAFYPTDKKINLGLDLTGGVHLVLRVQTDDALRSDTEITSERLRDTLTRNAVALTSIDVTAPEAFRNSGVTDDAGVRNATADAEATYARDAT